MNRTYLFRSLTAALCVAALCIGDASPTMAHEGDGVLSVEAKKPTGDRAVRYVVRLTWKNDGHAAIDSTMTATPITGDGAPQTPVPLAPADDDGRYAATVTFPAAGSWTVRFTAVTPAATAEIREDVAPPASVSTTTAPATTTTRETSTTSLPPNDTAIGDADQAAANDSTGDNDNGSNTRVIIAAVALVAILPGAVVGLARLKHRTRNGS